MSCTTWLALILAVGWAGGWARGQGTAAARPPDRTTTPPVQTTSSSPPGVDAAQAGGQALFAEGCARLTAGDPAAAISLLTRAARAQPQRREYSAKLAEAHLAWIDAALANQHWAVALARARRALRELRPSPALHLRAAQAYFGQGQVLGAVEVREVPNGRPGQFVNGWLLIARRGPRRFLCCPEASAFNQVRRALDAGLDEPAAHLLHARVWQKAGKPQIGLALLQSREAVLLETGGPRTLATFAELALEAHALDDYLRYSHMQAACQPQRRREILSAAYLAAAECYGQRGDGELYREFSYRALRLRPDDVELVLQVAGAEWSAGRHDEAAALYRRVLQLEPTHPRRGHILERLAARPVRKQAPR